MSATEVTVIDAGVGNLGNVVRAFGALGAAPTITDDPVAIARGRCLVLPGVGAFQPPRERLRGARETALRSALDDGAWLLGICVGFQLMFDAGDEFGEVDGLGLIPGRVTRLPAGVTLPHIGWNRLHPVGEPALLAGIEDGAAVYFVHSFAPREVADRHCLAQTRHGARFCAIAGRDRVFGTQFHPEKSGRVGLKILANFLEMAACS